jgi:hypothetical protein
LVSGAFILHHIRQAGRTQEARIPGWERIPGTLVQLIRDCPMNPTLLPPPNLFPDWVQRVLNYMGNP